MDRRERRTEKRLCKTTILFVLSLCLYGNGLIWGQPSDPTIESLNVKGNQRIETTAIVSQLTIKLGDRITNAVIREQIQRIYDMGFFQDVDVRTEPMTGGVRVIFEVQEKPFAVEIIFDGNDHLSDDKLQEVITLRSQVFLDQQQLKISTEKIRGAYQQEGYHNVQVVPIVQAIDETKNRITFYVREGKLAKIKTVQFEGISVVKKSDLLNMMANREWSLFLSWFTDAGVLRREELSNDAERIKEVYANRGYLDTQVGLPAIELSEDKEWFTVTYPIVEGFPYIINTIQFSGHTVFERQELEKEMVIHPGDVFQRAGLREEVSRITDLYGARGYSFAEVNPSLHTNPEEGIADITLTITEGSLISVREIRISGNDKTRDNVIRREIRINEQEVIDSVGIKRSFQRLNNLNFFETVEILPEQVEDDQVDLNVTVKEKPTGSFSIGGGFSTLDSFTLIANITEGNLFGRGYLGRIRGQLGGRRTLGVVTFRNPALFDSVTSLQLDGFRNRTDFLTYLQTRAGANVQFGRSFSEYVSGTFTLVGEHIKIDDPSSDAPEIILDQVGTQSTTGFRATLFRDSRDNYINPTEGSRTGIRMGVGTNLLGGSNDFYNVSVDGLKYTSLPFWSLVHGIRLRAGFAEGISGEALPLSEVFFVGGINTVRGFKFGRAGPVTDSGTLEGGNKQLILNNDLIFPILKDAKLNGVFFFDYGEGFPEGKNFSLSLRPAAGIELRWVSPFGPLRAALGKNLDPKNNEKKTVFEFSVGNVF
ncbi:MAG: outer membrane protein assembly factor BamA [Nitrospirales bacterium]|nr:outer membrane protein assembly factor BamA [Nitrospirales bacterium]